jgi:beta-carotene 3-hydroxylase
LFWILVNTAILIATVVAMETVAALVHRHVMHGWGWGWHRSHHEPRQGAFERNDLYAVVFVVLSVLLVYAGSRGAWPLQWIGWGMAAYGVLYAVFHDGLVHQRWPFRHSPQHPYLKRLVQAHRMHHAVDGREGCVSFGFLYAPPVRRLKEELRAHHPEFGTRPEAGERESAAPLTR